MENRCEKCEFLDIDYEWDDEANDEVNIYQCQKENEVGLQVHGIGCPYFKEFIAPEYIEKDTECDKCDILPMCIANGNCVEVTTSMDSRSHYILGFCAIYDK